MALQPKKMKFAKHHKSKRKGVARRGTTLSYGSFGLVAMGTKWITARQIEAARMAMARSLKKKGKIWIRIFPYQPITSKGSEADMGGGKGKVITYAFPIRPGRVIFELGDMTEEKAREVLRRAAKKMPIKTKFIIKKDNQKSDEQKKD